MSMLITAYCSKTHLFLCVCVVSDSNVEAEVNETGGWCKSTSSQWNFTLEQCDSAHQPMKIIVTCCVSLADE